MIEKWGEKKGRRAGGDLGGGVVRYLLSDTDVVLQ